MPRISLTEFTIYHSMLAVDAMGDLLNAQAENEFGDATVIAAYAYARSLVYARAALVFARNAERLKIGPTIEVDDQYKPVSDRVREFISAAQLRLAIRLSL